MQRRYVLLLLAVFAVCVFTSTGCGRAPRPDFWSWSAADSAQIVALVSAWKDSLKSHFEEDTALSEYITYVPDTTGKLLRKAVRDNPFKQHWFPRWFVRRFTSHIIVDSITQTKDTTVTVKLIEHFKGVVEIHPDSATKRLPKDSIVNGVPYPLYGNTSDTTGQPARRFTFMPRDSVFPQDTAILVADSGTSVRYLFLEPTNKATRDKWVLKRISGVGRCAFPDDAQAPFLGGLQLVMRNGRRDTIVLRPDSLHYGAQRLYA
ncbi:MAG: hypothetical protein ABIK62_03525, partial [candidate division WOR-3 bacterium]